MSGPQPGEVWYTPKDRTAEILARGAVPDGIGIAIHVIAYRFLGGSMVHLRAVDALSGWVKAEFD